VLSESREQRAESREQRAESREQRAESRGQRAESREHLLAVVATFSEALHCARIEAVVVHVEQQQEEDEAKKQGARGQRHGAWEGGAGLCLRAKRAVAVLKRTARCE
jgi:hypothetical protein